MIVGNIVVLDTIWYDRLGIVKGKDLITDEIKFYIGCCLGISEKFDINYIVKNGTKYTSESFKILTEWLNDKNTKDV